MRIGVVAARFNADVTDPMVQAAEERIRALGHDHAATLRVPGAFDTPLAVQHLLARAGVDGVVVLGAVIKGDTDHDQVLMYATTRTLQELSLRFDKAVALGITGPGMDHQGAVDRIDYAAAAVEACADLHAALYKA